MTVMTWVRARLPIIKINVTEINYSSLLTQAGHSNLNKSMNQYNESVMNRLLH